jgi:hypothetical protein
MREREKGSLKTLGLEKIVWGKDCDWLENIYWSISFANERRQKKEEKRQSVLDRSALRHKDEGAKAKKIC